MASYTLRAKNTRQTRQRTLRYGDCTHIQLLKFLKDRAGVVLDKKTNRARLISRLRDLDRNRAFPRFLELAPELRLEVYQYLLAPAQGTGEASRIHPALLRTSKLIFSEAEPIMYTENIFHIVITSYPTWGGYHIPDLKIERPGHRDPFSNSVLSLGYGSMINDLAVEHLPEMFRGLRKLTIELKLEPGLGEGEAIKARKMVGYLCLMLSDDSKIEELTFVLGSYNPDSAATADLLAHILLPLLLLRSDVVVRFQSASGALEFHTPEDTERQSRRALLPSNTSETICAIVKEVRHDYARDRKSGGLRKRPLVYYRYLDLEYLRKTESSLQRLAQLSVWVDLVDIASASSKWKSLQDCAAGAELQSWASRNPRSCVRRRIQATTRWRWQACRAWDSSDPTICTHSGAV